MERLSAPALPDWLASQVAFDRYLIEVGDGLKMHVMEQGHGRPVLLFHGNPTWGYLYRKVVAELQDEPFRLIMPDLIGLGFSDRPAAMTDHTLVNHSRWMANLLGQLELEDAIVVVQDWGGPIGLHSVSRHPGLMTGLVVMNTTVGAPKPGFTPTGFHRFFSTKAGELAASWMGLSYRILPFAQHDRTSISGVVQRSYAYPLKHDRGFETFVALVRMVPDSMDHPSVAPLAEAGEFAESFTGPMAIVWGRNDPLLGRLLRRVSRQLPNAEVTVTDAGHFLQEEVPGEIAAAIRSVGSSR